MIARGFNPIIDFVFQWILLLQWPSLTVSPAAVAASSMYLNFAIAVLFFASLIERLVVVVSSIAVDLLEDPPLRVDLLARVAIVNRREQDRELPANRWNKQPID